MDVRGNSVRVVVFCSFLCGWMGILGTSGLVSVAMAHFFLIFSC